MTDVLARRYLVLMRAYPEAYRRERGDEIVATLLERAGHRRWPPVREVLGLLFGASQAHLSPGGPVRRMWAGGLRVAVLALFAVQLANNGIGLLDSVSYGVRIGALQIMCGLVAFHAVLRDRRVVAVLATAAWLATWIRTGWLAVPLVVAMVLLLALLVLGNRERLGALRPAWWLAVPVTVVLLDWPRLVLPSVPGPPPYPPYPEWTYSYPSIAIIAVIGLLAVAALVDSRAAIVTTGLAVWQSLEQMVGIHWTGDNPSGEIFATFRPTTWGIVAIVLAVAMLVGGHLLARRRAALV